MQEKLEKTCYFLFIEEPEEEQLLSPTPTVQVSDYGTSAGPEPGPSRPTRRPGTRISRTRKYSEAVSGSVAKSISLVYPQRQYFASSYA
jgi:hypothetical protein